MSRPFLTTAALLITLVPAVPADAGEYVRIEGGSFLVGSESHYREERTLRRVTVGPFLIGRTEVTSAEFAEFVAATGYVTTAEKEGGAAAHPDWPSELRKPGSTDFAEPPASRSSAASAPTTPASASGGTLDD